MRILRATPLAFLLAAAALTGATPGVGEAQPPQKQAKQKLKQFAKQQVAAAEARKLALQEENARKAAAAKATAQPRKPQKPPAPLPAPVSPAALAQKIDAMVLAKISAEGLTPSPRSSDAEFLRRVSLDLAGVIPTAAEARAFLDDSDPAKREMLVDKLLADERYGKHLADLWAAKLYPIDSGNRFITKAPLRDWLAAEFNANTPWDQLVTKLVTATGTAEENPAVILFQANRSVDKLTDIVGTHFLGQSVACAQCHDHPFTPMEQTEYWGLAAFFSKVSIPRPRNPKQTGTDNAQLKVLETPLPSRQKDFFPDSTLKVSPSVLGGIPIGVAAREPYRPELAKWLTSPKNELFARAAANRTWAQLLGRGIVNPPEDMHDGNEPSHPELLAALAGQLAATKFDLKGLTKAIVLSETYQRTSKPVAGNEDDAILQSHRMVKVMSPEQLYDSLQTLAARVPAAAVARAGKAKGANGPMRNNPNARDQFVNFFLAGAEKPNAAEYEAGIPQALKLMNARTTLGNNPNSGRLFGKPGDRPADLIEEMVLATLSRRPTPAERAKFLGYARDGGPTAMADILWVLTNTSEFALIR
jgi:hypothetical protein